MTLIVTCRVDQHRGGRDGHRDKEAGQTASSPYIDCMGQTEPTFIQTLRRDAHLFLPGHAWDQSGSVAEQGSMGNLGCMYVYKFSTGEIYGTGGN